MRHEGAPLSEADRKTTLDKVYGDMTLEDRDPTTVVSEDYSGDYEKYLEDMAKYHGVMEVDGES